MKSFEYTTATSLPEALGQLREASIVAKAGGVDLLDRMKEGLVSPSRLVDIRGLAELAFVREDADGLHVGPLVTLAQLDANPIVRARYSVLADAAAHAATPQIRNMATLGGNLAQRPRCWYFRSLDFHCRKKGGDVCFATDGEHQYHAIIGNQLCAAVHPSTPATALMALSARVKLARPGAERVVSLDDFFVAPEKDLAHENLLAGDELITEIHVPAPSPSLRTAYHKQGEKESFDWPIADVAVALELDGKKCRRASIVLGAAAPVPWRARKAEALLDGKMVDEASANAAAEAALAGATPLARNGYKLQVFKTVIRRTILAAVGGAR